MARRGESGSERKYISPVSPSCISISCPSPNESFVWSETSANERVALQHFKGNCPPIHQERSVHEPFDFFSTQPPPSSLFSLCTLIDDNKAVGYNRLKSTKQNGFMLSVRVRVHASIHMPICARCSLTLSRAESERQCSCTFMCKTVAMFCVYARIGISVSLYVFLCVCMPTMRMR